MLSRVFNVDNPVFRAINTIGKIWLVNLLWLICSIPIFTMGASTSAMNYTFMKMQKDDGYIVQNFFHSFKENFKQATGIFFCYLIVGIILGVDMVLGNQTGGTVGTFIKIAACILAVPYALSLLYVFGVQSRFVNSVKDTIKYSFFLALRRYKETIQMVILTGLVIWANTTVLAVNAIMLFYGFGLLGFFFAAYYRRAFSDYLGEESEDYIGESYTHNKNGNK